MNARVWIAGLVGGIVIFVWGFLSHMTLGLWDDAFKPVPHEAEFRAELKKNAPEPGLFFFPWMDTGDSDPKAQEAWEESAASGPSGMLVYLPTREKGLMPKQLALELVSNVLQSLVCAFLLSRVAGGVSSYFGRVCFVGLMGLLPPLAISVSYWNWYSFPRAFATTEFVDQLASFFLCGIALAAIIKPKPE